MLLPNDLIFLFDSRQLPLSNFSIRQLSLIGGIHLRYVGNNTWRRCLNAIRLGVLNFSDTTLL